MESPAGKLKLVVFVCACIFAVSNLICAGNQCRCTA
jgi:hypothetical protein